MDKSPTAKVFSAHVSGQRLAKRKKKQAPIKRRPSSKRKKSAFCKPKFAKCAQNGGLTIEGLMASAPRPAHGQVLCPSLPWHLLLYGQPLHPPPHELLPDFLSLIITAMTAPTISATISATIIVPILLRIYSSILKNYLVTVSLRDALSLASTVSLVDSL